jgi:hypothetical protein
VNKAYIKTCIKTAKGYVEDYYPYADRIVWHKGHARATIRKEGDYTVSWKFHERKRNSVASVIVFVRDHDLDGIVVDYC